ncbi:unnamed protein product, partial [marine sediment metagenome]
YSNCEIYIMNIDGSGQTRLTNKGGRGSSFSPDGSKIVFISDRDGNPETYIMNVDGSEQTRLTYNPKDVREGGGGYSCFSPDGSKIAFTSYRHGNPEGYSN